MTRRGFTLIELLLAIGLLLAIAALTMPTFFSGLAERAYDSAADILQNQLLLARSEAIMTGRPVEVLYEPDPPRVVARYFEVDSPEPAPGSQRSAEGDTVELDVAAAGDPIVESWADHRLPDGLALAREAEPVEAQAASSPTDDRVLRLAVFMPDGSALLRGDAWLRDEHGRRGRCVVNPFTGMPSFERVDAGAQAGDAVEQAPTPEDDEPDFDRDEPENGP